MGRVSHCSQPGAEAASGRWEAAGLDAFDFLSDEYRDLFARSDACVFQSPLWLDRIYGRLAPRLDAKPLIVTVRHRGRLVAVLPLAVRLHRGMHVAEFADFGVSDYCAVVADREAFAGLDGQMPWRLVRQALKGCDMAVARKVPAPALAGFGIFGKLRSSSMAMQAHAAELSPSFAQWRERSISPSQRKFLDIKRRKLLRQGKVDFTVCTAPGEIAEALAHIRRFRDHRFRETGLPDLLRDEVFAAFYREAGGEAPPARGYMHRVDGVPVSALFGLVRGGRFHLLLSGFDFAAYRNLSLGLLLIEDAIADCIARGETAFDFTIGDQAYKKEFGTTATPMHSVWIGVSLCGRVLAFLLSRSRRVRQWARRLRG